MSWIAGLGAGAELIGQSMANDRNSKMANRQMEFQERLSSTAHQREVEDLRAAGLNPILSANGGASSPGGAIATAQNVAEGFGSSAYDLGRRIAEIKGLTASAKEASTRAEANKKNAEMTEVNRQIGEAEKRIREADAWSAENALDWKKKNPNFFGIVDTWGKAIGQIGNSANSFIRPLNILQRSE